MIKTISDIKQTEPGWSETVVMICNRCGDGESAERLKSELKAKSKEEFGKKVRVITTSCLGICPKDKIAIAVASSNCSEVFKAYEVETESSGEELFLRILK